MYPPKIKAVRLVAGCMSALTLSAWLGGCSNPSAYLDRRDTIFLGAGDAIAANKAQMIVDPWPAYSGNNNIAFNGQKMQSAVERYRTGKVIQPSDPQSPESSNQGSQNVTQTTVNTGGAPASVSTPGQ